MSGETFRLGYVPGAMPGKWARIWRERVAEPLELVQVDAGAIIGTLLCGDVDAGLVRLPVDRSVFSAIKLYDELSVVVVPKDHLLAATDDDEQVALGDLVDEIVFVPANDTLFRPVDDVPGAGTGTNVSEGVVLPGRRLVAYDDADRDQRQRAVFGEIKEVVDGDVGRARPLADSSEPEDAVAGSGATEDECSEEHRADGTPDPSVPPLQPTDAAEAMAWVANGVGLTIVPMSLARLHHRKDVTYRVLVDGPTSPVGLAWLTDRTTPQVELLIGIVRGRTVNSSRGGGSAPAVSTTSVAKQGKAADAKAGHKADRRLASRKPTRKAPRKR